LYQIVKIYLILDFHFSLIERLITIKKEFLMKNFNIDFIDDLIFVDGCNELYIPNTNSMRY